MIGYVYFLGIGGIGMSALARYYRHTGALLPDMTLRLQHLRSLWKKKGWISITRMIPVTYPLK